MAGYRKLIADYYRIIDAPKMRAESILSRGDPASVRLGPESLLPPALDTEIIKVASAQADLGDRDA